MNIAKNKERGMQYSLGDLRAINSFEVKYRDKETDTDYLFWGKVLNIRNIIDEDMIHIDIWDWHGDEAYVDESSRSLDWINEWINSHKAIPVYDSTTKSKEVNVMQKRTMLSKNDSVKSMKKNKEDRREFARYMGETWDFVSKAYFTLDEMCRSGYCPEAVFSKLDELAVKLKRVMTHLEDVMDEYNYDDMFPKSTKKSKSVRKSNGDIDWKVTYICDLNSAINRGLDDDEINYYDPRFDRIGGACDVVINLMEDLLSSEPTKKSKREILKAKVDELLDEEDDDEIAKPRMKDMFLDSKRKSRKSTKSNDEKGEDADEYREESDGDDVSDSKVMKPEDANDNEDENEAPSGGNPSLPEDADGQENQSAKRKKRMSKFSVTAGGSQRYDGRQNYNQSPMMREAIDRFKAEKDLVKSLQGRVDEINGARKNTEVNNKSPLRIKGRY